MIVLHPDEKVILEVRRHWFIFFTETVFLAIFLALPALTSRLLNYWSFLDQPLTVKMFAFATTVWYLLIWVIFFILWTNFYLDVWLITNQRIVDVEQYALFQREVSEFRLDNMQDITTEVHGLIPTLLGYGDVSAETAGERQRFIIHDAPHPEKVKETITQLQSQILNQYRSTGQQKSSAV